MVLFKTLSSNTVSGSVAATNFRINNVDISVIHNIELKYYELCNHFSYCFLLFNIMNYTCRFIKITIFTLYLKIFIYCFFILFY